MIETRTLSAVTSQFSVACSLTALFCMMTLSEGQTGRFFPQSLLIYAPLIYVFNSLLLRRERTMLSLCLWNIAAGAALIAAYLFLETWRGLSHLVFFVAFVAWLTVKGCHLAMHGADLRGTLLCLDGSTIILILFTAYTAYLGIESTWSVPTVCGFAAAVVGVIASRNGQYLSWKAWLLMAAAFGAIFLGMRLLVSFAAAPAGQGIVTVWELLISAVRSVGSALLHLLEVLLSLFPDADPGEMMLEAPIPYASGELTVQEADPKFALAAFGILGVLAAILVSYVIRWLRNVKLGGTNAKAAAPVGKRRRISFWRGLQSLAASWTDYLRLRMFLWRNRDTPKGLYFFLVYRCRRGPWRKRPGETPREFLTRLTACARGNQPLAAALEQLVCEVDKALYSGRPNQTRIESAGLICRQIDVAVRRQFLRERLNRSKQKHFANTVKNPPSCCQGKFRAVRPPDSGRKR